MNAASRAVALRIAAVLGAGAALAACAPDRTMLVVRVDSDLAVPDAMNSVRVVVSHAGKTLQSLPFSLAPGTNALPLEVGLLSPSGGGAAVEVDVSGSLGATFVVGQQAITSFVPDKSLVLEMFLAADCVSFTCPDPSQTCTKGQVCVDKARPPSALPSFEPQLPHPHDAATGGAGPVDAADGARRGPSAGAGGVSGTAGGGAGAVEAGAHEARPDGAVDRGVEAAPELRPGCVPVAEDCLNGLDDDCDGLNDCADPDCAPVVVCVPRPSGDVGAIVGPTDACPKGFAFNNTATPFGVAVDPGGAACGGCACAQATSTTTCSATLTTYTSTADCQAGTNGKDVGTISSASSDPCPVPDTSTATVFGAALSAWTVSSSGCGPSGAPARPTATFASSKGFCRSANLAPAGRDVGCPAGSVCMRRPPAGTSACVVLADASACPAGTNASAILYAGIQDDRACGPCTCDVQGASCDALTLEMGSDYGCGLDTADIHGGARTCTTTQPTSGVYTPGYHLTGAPGDGTCKPTSALSGAVTPTGGRALCCLP